MRHTLTLTVLAAMFVFQGAALAQEDVPYVPPPPDEMECKAEALPQGTAPCDELQSSYDTCQETQKKFVAWAKDNCPILKGKSNDEVLKTVNATPAPRPHPPVTTGGHGGNKGGGKGTGGGKKPPTKPRLTTYIGMQRFKKDPGCPGAGLKFTAWVDVDGDGKFGPGDTEKDAQVSCDGVDGKNGHNVVEVVETLKKGDKTCPAGGIRRRSALDLNDNNAVDEKGALEVVVCNGVDGKSANDGRPGKDGAYRIQVGLGMRTASIFTADRPYGVSVSPELQIDYWLSPTVELSTGLSWAWGGDRNMTVTTQLCHRGLNSRLAFCGGGQYQAWNLEGLQALWHSGLAIATAKVVIIDSKYVDFSLEAGAGVGFDGYDQAMQFAWGLTGQGTLTFKLH